MSVVAQLIQLNARVIELEKEKLNLEKENLNRFEYLQTDWKRRNHIIESQAAEIERLKAELKMCYECAEQEDAEIDDANYAAEFNKKRCEELEAEIDRLQARIALLNEVVEDAKTFLRVSEMYEKNHTAFLWEQGELIKSLAKLEEST